MMAEYMLTEKPDGTIEFWTNDEELRLRVSQNIADIADAISYRRQIKRASTIIEKDREV
jgi:hypothetical protein